VRTRGWAVPPWSTDRGSGSLSVVALGGAVATLTALALPLYIGLAERHSIASAADAAALAAANVASGLFVGYPCAKAATVAAANTTEITRCEIDGLIVTVGVTGAVLGIPVTVVATAGPPRTELD
jgi:secretion/DNA translocation related TadE-like protein